MNIITVMQIIPMAAHMVVVVEQAMRRSRQAPPG
jgi:hypothetical protein